MKLDANQTVALIIDWLTKINVVALLLLLSAVTLHALGINLPLHGIGHVELAYLAGALYLIRR